MAKARLPGAAVLAADLDRLLDAPGWPAVSVLCPAGRTEWRGLLDEARDRLESTVGHPCVAELLERLEAAGADLDAGDWPAIGVFANPRLVHAVALPQPVKPRVVIDNTFATRDLIAGMARTPRYLVLTISGSGAQLWNGLGQRLLPAPSAIPFPDRPDTAERRHHRERSQARDAHFDRGNRALDQTLDRALRRGDQRPVFVVGQHRRAHRYAATSRHADRFAAVITANPNSPTTTLAELVADHLDRELQARAETAIETVGAAIGASRFAGGISEVWPLAHEGRIRVLVAEEHYHQPGTIDPDTGTFERCGLPRPGGIDDAVDEVIEAVVTSGGQVEIVPTDALADWDRIAARLRH